MQNLERERKKPQQPPVEKDHQSRVSEATLYKYVTPRNRMQSAERSLINPDNLALCAQS